MLFKRTLLVFLLAVFCFPLFSQNNSLLFYGYNQYVKLPYSPSLDFTSSDRFSIEFWYKPNVWTTGTIISNMGTVTPQKGYEISVSGGVVKIDLINSYPGNCLRIATTSTISQGQWHHIAFVFHGASAPEQFHLYVDGEPAQTLVTHNSLTGSFSTGSAVWVGARQANGGTYGTQLDELRFWSRNLCPGEISRTKDCELTGSEPDLVAYYNFNQGIANGNNVGLDSLIDKSPNNLTGHLNGMVLTGTTSNWVPGAGVSGVCNPSPGKVNIILGAGASGTVCPGYTTTLTALASAGATFSWTNGPATMSNVVSPFVPTVYSVSVSGTTLCPGTATFMVHTAAVPTLVLNSPPSVCPGSSVELSATGAQTYTWIPGMSTNSSVILYLFSSTVYTVIGSAGGCTTIANATAIVDAGTVSGSVPQPVCIGQGVTIFVSGTASQTWQPGGMTSAAITVTPMASTSYTAFTTSLKGCPLPIVVDVTISPLPTISLSGPTLTCSGSTVTLIANGAKDYLWEPGGMTGFYVVDQPTVTTTYTVQGISTEQCIGTGTMTLVVETCTAVGVGENQGPSLKIFPNPFHDFFIVEGGGVGSVFKLYDVTGRMLKQVISAGSTVYFDTRELQPGYYILSVTEGSRTFSSRLVKT